MEYVAIVARLQVRKLAPMRRERVAADADDSVQSSTFLWIQKLPK